MANSNFDFLIVGGGIFGCYAAHFLAKKGVRVALVEKEKALFLKASVVNQARLHGGYHYPRSMATAVLSDEHKSRFTEEHRGFVNASFQKFYAIDRAGSFTDARQFERFCQHLGIRCDRVEAHELFNFDRIEALFLTEEHSFDPVLIAAHYQKLIENAGSNISLFKNTWPLKAETQGHEWLIELENGDGKTIEIKAKTTINATYAASNAINRMFGGRDLELMHEISEMAFLTSKACKNVGLTVMDGPFGSVMPYGLSGFLSLSSVAYTHHAVSFENLPTFDCQKINEKCRPDFTADCNDCPARPRSNSSKMLAQMRAYFSEKADFEYAFSKFTIKSKLKSSHIDDGRPTEIAQLRRDPAFFCLFAGKINSIYEVEKIV